MHPSNARRPTRPSRVGWIGLLALAASPALAVTPLEPTESVHAELPVGPPAPALHRDASRQLALSANPRLRALASRWGGAWTWRFDERSGRPYSAALPGVSWRHAEALVDDLRATLGPDITLREVREAQSGERWVLVYEQVHDGLPLFGTELALFALSGRIQAARTAVVPPPRRSAPAGAELWFPVDDGAHVRYEPAVWTEADDIVRILHAEDGRELAAWSLRHYATVELQHDERNPGSAILTSPLTDAAVDDGTGVQYTDSAGVHTAADPYDLLLAGQSLRVRDFADSGGPVPRFEGIEGDRELTVGGEGDLRFAAADGWHHTKVVEAWLASRNADHAILDIQVQALVNRGDFRCNAFYTGGTINFARKYGSCANTGRLADVIYHEYGHGVHHYGLLAGTFAGDLSEGTADYISATILDDPRVGLGFFGDSRSLRDISVDRVYPDNFRGQVHNDGRIWGSFLWEAGAGTPWEEAQGSWVNQWTFDPVPEEGLFSPTEAWSGEKVAGTALGELYRNLNVQYLRSPPLAVPEDGRMPLLTFRRWLTVEDSKYDKARLFLDDAQVWQQGGTDAGLSHTLDTRWVRFELDAEDLRGTEPRLTWVLRSDPGLEFGGWALDEVCVERLADLPAHHRVVDLELSVDEEDRVTARWSNPWIAPLDEVIVVRTRGGLPTGRDVGVWVFDDAAPEPTVAHELVDAETEPCTTYGYAVLVRGDGVWYEAVVDGDNAGTVRTACVDDPDVELPDPVDPSVDGEVGAVDAYRLPEIEGCGCQAPLRGSAAGAWLALFGLVLLRRRKR